MRAMQLRSNVLMRISVSLPIASLLAGKVRVVRGAREVWRQPRVRYGRIRLPRSLFRRPLSLHSRHLMKNRERQQWVDSTNSAHAIAVTRSAPEFGDRFDVQSEPARMISSMTALGSSSHWPC